MIKPDEAERIKRLIKKGFDLELISFEFDIPIEQINQYKKEIERSQKVNRTKTYSVQEIIDARNNEAHLKIEKMRERYKTIYFGSNKIENKLLEELPQQDIEIVEEVIKAVEQKIQQIKNTPQRERREIAKSVLEEISKIEEYQLTIEQAEKLKTLMNAEEFEKQNFSRTDTINKKIYSTKRKIEKRLIKAIDISQYQTTDVAELKELEKRLILITARESQLEASAVKSRITNKVQKLEHQKIINRIKNDVPTNISQIITDFANGTIDINKANEVIEEEAKRRVEGKTSNKFRVTSEQEKIQIFIQIRKIIREKADVYCIKNPEKTVLQIQKLCGGRIEDTVRIVVDNLIKRKEFEEAKILCDKFKGEDKESELAQEMAKLKRVINTAELGNKVLELINTKRTIDEERACLELIEKNVTKRNIKLGAIPLGKTQDGSRNISLANIWPDEEVIGKSR